MQVPFTGRAPINNVTIRLTRTQPRVVWVVILSPSPKQAVDESGLRIYKVWYLPRERTSGSNQATLCELPTHLLYIHL